MFCIKCGKSITEEMELCPFCGCKIETDEVVKERKESSDKSIVKAYNEESGNKKKDSVEEDNKINNIVQDKNEKHMLENSYQWLGGFQGTIREKVDLVLHTSWNLLYGVVILLALYTAWEVWREYAEYSIYSKCVSIIFGIASMKILWFIPLMWFLYGVLSLKKDEILEGWNRNKYLLGYLINMALGYLLIIVLGENGPFAEEKAYALLNQSNLNELGSLLALIVIISFMMIWITEKWINYVKENRDERYKNIWKSLTGKEKNIEYKKDDKERQKKDKKGGFITVIVIGLIVIIGILVLSGLKSCGKKAYLDNTSDKLPIKINNVAVLNSYYMYTAILYSSQNDSGEDIETIKYGVTAWDENRLPVTLDGEYLLEFTSRNLNANDTEEKEYDISDQNIRYIQVLPLEYETFEGKKWKNPARELYKKNYAGKKLDLEKMHCFELDLESEVQLQGILHESSHDVKIREESEELEFESIIEKRIRYVKEQLKEKDLSEIEYVDEGQNYKDGILLDAKGNPVLSTDGNPVKDVRTYMSYSLDEFSVNLEEYKERPITIEDCSFTYMQGALGIEVADTFIYVIPTKQLYDSADYVHNDIFEGAEGEISGVFFVLDNEQCCFVADHINVTNKKTEDVLFKDIEKDDIMEKDIPLELIQEDVLEYMFKSIKGYGEVEECLFACREDMTRGAIILYDANYVSSLIAYGDMEENDSGNLVITDEVSGTNYEISVTDGENDSLMLGVYGYRATFAVDMVEKAEFKDILEKIVPNADLEEANSETSYDMNDFIGATGSYFSTSGGSERGIGMEVYDSGNGNVSITFKSITHNGVVSAQGIVTGSDTIEANWNDAQFLLTWTDGGEVTVVRSGSTGYSDIDEFTGYETYINNAYYQVG